MLVLDDVTVRYGDRAAVDGVGLDVAEHEIVSVLGPSGSGKSTLLRAVAGLQPVSAGRVLLDGRDLAGVPAHRRELGLMFQDQQLFPHRDVGGNVAFGLRMHGASRAAARDRVAELLALVGLPGEERRPVGTLSGGEQQRVALARALAPSPRLLMLDEPLGQLDRSLRERLVVELRQLFRKLGTTVLAVTHDQGEAFALADRVVVMREGRIAQTGTPVQVWERPADEFVARFLGFANVVRGTVHGEVADTPWGKVGVPPGGAPGPEPAPGSKPEPVPVSGERTLLVRPAGVRVGETGSGLDCEVVGRTFRGDHVVLLLRPERGPELESSVPLRGAPEVGERVAVSFAPEEVVVLAG